MCETLDGNQIGSQEGKSFRNTKFGLKIEFLPRLPKVVSDAEGQSLKWERGTRELTI